MGAAIDGGVAVVFLGGSIDTTGEGQSDDIQFSLQQVIDDLDHALNGHGLLGDYQSALRVGLAELGLEGGSHHAVLWCAKADAGLLIDIEDSG